MTFLYPWPFIVDRIDQNDHIVDHVDRHDELKPKLLNDDAIIPHIVMNGPGVVVTISKEDAY